MFIVHADLYSGIATELPRLEKLGQVLVFGGQVPEGAASYEAALAEASPYAPVIATRADDVHVIRFSAGTTGRPKGIVHMVERWLANDDEYRWVTPQIDERDAYLAAGQLTHEPGVEVTEEELMEVIRAAVGSVKKINLGRVRRRASQVRCQQNLAT